MENCHYTLRSLDSTVNKTLIETQVLLKYKNVPHVENLVCRIIP